MESKKIVLKVFITLGVIATIALIATSPQIASAIRERKEVVKAFTEYSNALTSQRLQDAYGYCDPAFREAVTLEQFISLQTTLQNRYGPLKSVKQGSLEVTVREKEPTHFAIVRSDFSYEKRTVQFVYELRLESGAWKIWGYKEL